MAQFEGGFGLSLFAWSCVVCTRIVSEGVYGTTAVVLRLLKEVFFTKKGYK